jgi:hypothetical protein
VSNPKIKNISVSEISKVEIDSKRYNKDLEISEKEIKSGRYYSHNQVKDQIEKWKLSSTRL